MKLRMSKQKTLVIRPLSTKPIIGNPNGKNLYQIIYVDDCDTEDTMSELCRADTMAECKRVVRDMLRGDNPNALDKEMAECRLQNDWGTLILATRIATID